MQASTLFGAKSWLRAYTNPLLLRWMDVTERYRSLRWAEKSGRVS